MKNMLKKLALLLVSLVLTLCTIEGALFIASRVYYRYRLGSASSSPRNTSALRILCIGDSYTFGMGAAKGYSYPEQLDVLLKERFPDKKFHVVNLGVPGNTSFRVRKELNDKFFAQYRPDVVVLLVGVNDFDGIRDNACMFLPKGYLRNTLHCLERFLEHFRTGRILKLAVDTLLAKIWQKRISVQYGRSVLAGDTQIRKDCSASQEIEQEYKKFIERGETAFNAHSRDIESAIEAYGKAIELLPFCDRAYLDLARLYLTCIGREGYPGPAYVLGLFKKAESINPRNPRTYYDLWRFYYGDGQLVKAREALEKYLYLVPEHIPEYVDVFKYGLPWTNERQPYLDLYRKNLQEIISALRQKGVKAVLQVYPQEEDFMVSTLEVARQNKVPLVDNTFF